MTSGLHIAMAQHPDGARRPPLPATRDNGARLLGAVQETPWAAQHGKLVLVTAEVRCCCML